MGINIKVSKISRLIIYYILIINTCCDISLINCDIHKMRQNHVNKLKSTTENSEAISVNEVDFKINATELEQHIMNGLNMTNKPDIDMVSVIESSLKLIEQDVNSSSPGVKFHVYSVASQALFWV